MTPTQQTLTRLLQVCEGATPGPWRWEDQYSFREHIEHKKQGLNADCENIRDGRMTLEPDVLSEWNSYADDAGLQIKLEDAKYIETFQPATMKLLLGALLEYRTHIENECLGSKALVKCDSVYPCFHCKTIESVDKLLKGI